MQIFPGTKDILGFSILFSLFCARGTVYYLVRAIRTRCACVNHLNVKLMVEALVVTGLSHYDLMDFAVCGTDRKDCMFGKGWKPRRRRRAVIHGCHRGWVSSWYEHGRKHILKQWASTDRCTLLDHIEQRDVFMLHLSQCIVRLTRHHMVSKLQSRFYRDMKKNG